MSYKKEIETFSKKVKFCIAYPAWVYQPIQDVANVIFKSFFDADIVAELRPINSSQELNIIAQSSNYTHILVVNVHDFLAKEKSFYLDKPKVTKLLAYNLEQTPIKDYNSSWASMRLSEVGFYASYFDYIVTESPNKNYDLRNLGLRILNLNIPYHECLDFFPDHKHTVEEKKYDVFFIGCGSKRRDHALQELSKMGVTFAPNAMPHALDPHYKAQMVRESKVCLNIHFSDMEYFEKPRILLDFFMHKGLVVTEKIIDPEIFGHNKHFLMAKYPNIVPTVLIALKNYEQLIGMGELAYNKYKEMHAPEKVVGYFMADLYKNESLIARKNPWKN